MFEQAYRRSLLAILYFFIGVGILLLILFFLVMVGGIDPVRSASFQCKGNTLPIERTICKDRNLSNLDDAMTDIFQNFMTSHHFNDDLKIWALEKHKRWINERDMWYDNPECLIWMYSDHIRWIGEVIEMKDKVKDRSYITLGNCTTRRKT